MTTPGGQEREREIIIGNDADTLRLNEIAGEVNSTVEETVRNLLEYLVKRYAPDIKEGRIRKRDLLEWVLSYLETAPNWLND